LYTNHFFIIISSSLASFISEFIILGTANIYIVAHVDTFSIFSLYVPVTFAIAFFVVAAFAWFVNGILYDNHHSVTYDNWYSTLLFATLYVYSLLLSGSVGFFDRFLRFVVTLSHTVHCVHAVDQLYVI
jgi:hypothetical protein